MNTKGAPGHVIVCLDDAQAAGPALAALMAGAPPGTRWVVVACAPRMTHRVSKWLSHRARENWRERWARRLHEELARVLPHGAPAFAFELARQPVPEVWQRWQQQAQGNARLVDLRRAPEPPGDAPTAWRQGWVAQAVAGLSLAWWMALE